MLVLIGEPGRFRTGDLLIKSQLLYQLSYGPIGDGRLGMNLGSRLPLVNKQLATRRCFFYALIP